MEHRPEQLYLVISTRADPPLPLAKLRARRALLDLRQADLSFTWQEAADFLKHTMGLQISSEDAARITARTEGWIAGLQMAALSMQNAGDISSFITSLNGSHHYVFDYLLEEILGRQDPEIRRFLLFTSIVDQLTAPLCDALLEGEDALSSARSSAQRLGARHRWRFRGFAAERRRPDAAPGARQRGHPRRRGWPAALRGAARALMGPGRLRPPHGRTDASGPPRAGRHPGGALREAGRAEIRGGGLPSPPAARRNHAQPRHLPPRQGRPGGGRSQSPLQLPGRRSQRRRARRRARRSGRRADRARLLSAREPDLPRFTSGFSFGAWMALRAGCADPAVRGVLARTLADLVDAYPRYVMLKGEVPLAASRMPAVLARLRERFVTGRGGGVATIVDGLRVDWPDRWFHVRVSQTEPIVRVISEQRGEAPEALHASLLEEVRRG